MIKWVGKLVRMNKEDFIVGICPECKGLALVLNHEPTDEVKAWANRVSAQRMINWMVHNNCADDVTPQEFRYAHG